MFLLPDIGTIFWTTIIFALTVFLLAKYAWKPLIGIVQEREKSIDAALKAAESAQSKVSNLRNEQERITRQTQLHKEQIISEANEQRDKIVAEAKTQAEKQTKKMIDEARVAIDREREAALLEMKTQITNLSIDIATKIIHSELEDKQKHRKMIENLIDQIELN
jgi:F-type H+-transporting ATPase subunit b